MSTPKLTIGIPTLNRPEHLQHAIDSCLIQTVPVHIIVADQGKTEETARLMDRYADNPNVEHLPTEATCLWENWEAAALACDTPYFAWLQDDDVLARIYSYRVNQAFERSPEALHWQATCYCSVDGNRAERGAFNGPQVGLLIRDSGAEVWPGHFLLASMYIGSWSLSPGVAFRCGEAFNEVLRQLPKDCDLFQERLVLAAMGLCGPWVADSVTAGYWNQHKTNESLKQNLKEGEGKRQLAVMIENLDSLLEQSDSWREGFYAWLHTRSPVNVLHWIKNWECKESRYSDELLAIMQSSVDIRMRQHGIQPVKPEPAPAALESDVVYC